MASINEVPLYFMVQSPSGKTHAINPKTQLTYCGNAPDFDEGWQSRDVAPSDTHQPTCKICLRHYDDPFREALRNVADDFKRTIGEHVDTKVDLKDAKGLQRFVSQVTEIIRNDHERARYT